MHDLSFLSRLVNAQVDEMCSEANMMTLGELLGRCEQALHEGYLLDAEVVFSNGGFPDLIEGFRSYRGYYHHVAIGRGADGDAHALGDFIAELKHAIGATYEGYKGGKYRMSKGTPVWVSEWGEASDNGVTGIHFLDDGQTIVLEVSEIE